MSDYLKTFIIAVLQGITEWLPVSSTGHMIILGKLLSLDVSDEFFALFLVVVQLGSALAVFVKYFSKLSPAKAFKSKSHARLWFKILFATAPAVIFGLLFDDKIGEVLYNPFSVSVTLVVYGVLFIYLDFVDHKLKRYHCVDDISLGSAMVIGIFQALALVPGTSRSGATMIGGTVVGSDKKTAAEFSFFLALPVMIGASILKMLKFGFDFSHEEITILMLGTIVAFLVSLVTIDRLVEFVKRRGFSAFGIYRIILGILILIFL